MPPPLNEQKHLVKHLIFGKVIIMTNEAQIKALAELDGFTQWPVSFNKEQKIWALDYAQSIDCQLGEDVTKHLPKYLTSYDAIIPLCFKYWGDWFWKTMRNKATPPQLCEVLLRASNKWTE